jgi:hypothetical protein
MWSFQRPAVGSSDWLDLLWQHKDISCRFGVFECHLVLGASRDGDDLVELGCAGQFEHAIARDLSANADEFVGRGTELPTYDRCVANRATSPIENATTTAIWCRSLAAAHDNEHR